MNQNGYVWFKARMFGWGWMPVAWQGWLVVFLFAAAISFIFALIDSRSHSVSDTLIAFFFPNGLALFCMFLAICYVTSEKPSWHREKDAPPAVQTSVIPPSEKKLAGTVSFDEFKHTELKIVTILSAERMQNSDKLLKLRVSLGTEERSIIAGIGKAYEPSALIGKHIAIIANLEPRMLMGIESQGMVLAAHADDGKPVLLVPEKEVAPGSSVS